MEYIFDMWSLVVVLFAAFVIGWGAETAQAFISRTLALTILAWLQTTPEFAVEAAIAWSQQRDLMIANLTGSLRLLVGLGWPMIFFVHFFSQGWKTKKFARSIKLDSEDSLSVFFLFLSVVYFFIVLWKQTLTCVDSIFLGMIYFAYLLLMMRLPVQDVEEHEDMPWVSQQIMKLSPGGQKLATLGLFAVGGVALYVSVHPFIETLQRWSVALGVSTFVFIQWVAPFLSEFPEKVTAFNWARQKKKAGMALMNMVNSNINQWTMLAAMIPIVFNLSLGKFEPVHLDQMHRDELSLTIWQSMLAGLLILNLEFTVFEAALLGTLWLAQFVYAPLRGPITYVYVAWCVFEAGKHAWHFFGKGERPRALVELAALPIFRKKRRAGRA